MNLSKVLLDIKKKKNLNYNKYLRTISNLEEDEIIKHSYDLQTGTYIKSYLNNKKKYKLFIDEITEIIKKNFVNCKTFIDCGCGEMTISYSLIKKLTEIKKFYLFDISINRMNIGKKFLIKKLNKKKVKLINFFCCNLDSIPLKSNSIDLVFTHHALEPNKKNSKQIIKQLFRICNYGMILNEPDYTSSSQLQKKWMKKNNYVLNIPKILNDLKINFKKVKIKNSLSKKNQTTSFIIFKNNFVKKKEL